MTAREYWTRYMGADELKQIKIIDTLLDCVLKGVVCSDIGGDTKMHVIKSYFKSYIDDIIEISQSN